MALGSGQSSEIHASSLIVAVCLTFCMHDLIGMKFLHSGIPPIKPTPTGENENAPFLRYHSVLRLQIESIN